MGKVFSIITKPIRHFNLESRAHAVIAKDKPTVAPRHKPDQMNYERLMKDYPDVFQESLKKHEKLDENLKNIYIKSHDPIVEVDTKSKTDPERPLPKERTFVEGGEYGFHEPTRVPVGKVTLRTALRFISENRIDSKTHNATKIAEDYLLPEETVRNILKYFRVYEMYIPQQRKVKASFAGPSIPQKRIIQQQNLLQNKEEKEMFKD